jgi:bifunctional non-homologous end joining protein LigD
MASSRKKLETIGAKAPFPGFIPPALASPIERVPSGERWIHEIKFDGYRVQVHIIKKDAKVFTRRGNHWTKRFRKIAEDAAVLPAMTAIIDGEVVVPSAAGTTDFSVLQNELRGRSRQIVLVAFDLFLAPGLWKVPPKGFGKHLRFSYIADVL